MATKTAPQMSTFVAIYDKRNTETYSMQLTFRDRLREHVSKYIMWHLVASVALPLQLQYYYDRFATPPRNLVGKQTLSGAVNSLVRCSLRVYYTKCIVSPPTRKSRGNFEISVVCVVRAMWKRRQWRLSLALHMPFISTTRLVSDTRPFSGCFVVQPQLKRPKQELLGYARHSLYLQQTQQSTLRALPFGRPTSCGARKKTASCYK